jgi:hypothetical protein
MEQNNDSLSFSVNLEEHANEHRRRSAGTGIHGAGTC